MKPHALSWPLLAVALSATVVAAFPQRGGGGGRAPAPAGERAPAAPAADQDDLSAVYFEAADWDGDGMLRFSEAEQSLRVDREGFGLFDRDNDGLVTPEEFAARYRRVVERDGVFTAPRPKPAAARAPKRDAKALLAAYDADLDGLLSESELAVAMHDARIDEPTPAELLAALDKDASSGIDGSELDALSDVLSPGAKPSRAKRLLTLDELFDRTDAPNARRDATISPRRTTGPISVYRRLDYDRSGAVDLKDLEELQRPLRSAVRPAAVLATLDADGDGSISASEFEASMR